MTDDTPRTLGEFADPQPTPTTRPEAPSLHDVAAALHRRRRDTGIRTYGTQLTTHNGRTAGVDLTQELADGLVYAIQGTLEHAALTLAVAEFQARLTELVQVWGHEVATVREVFDELLGPDAVTARADALAQAVIEDAGSAS